MTKKEKHRRYKLLFLNLPFITLIIFIILAVFGDLIAPFDPNQQNLLERFSPPAWMEGSSQSHILGTDHLGRDLLSRIIIGSQVSIVVGLCAMFISGLLGTLIGLLSGYYKTIDQLFMRIADIQLAFPTILLALAIIAVVGGSLSNLIIILGVTGWVPYARVVRSEVYSLRTNDFVTAAKTIGVRDKRILYKHILPNILAPVTTIATFQVASAIIAESSLSFLGLGVPVNTPSWGNILSEGQLYMESSWWISVFPGLCIVLVVLSINILGDRWRDIFNPKSSTN
ncbi:ABC transporter permease [Oceanobacillus jeddahense]|uniref:ABC transporter permease n=1 Tax=Oceanobacillus jeddahense TaxID=1462527 RepID=A0ABY5JS43_9BACI|nr:ABC transporter permease [Oceanobacillus jeddahense]UUI02262.1 ABC transporter permease [Oceanobacillus jeddahense]